MGGDYYTDDSGASRSVGTAAAGGGFSAASAAVFVQTGADDAVLPPNRLKDGKDPGLVTSCATPIVVALDVTASRGDDAKILYDKLPMFYGSIMTNAYTEDPQISFAAIGDAPCDDRFPIQIGDFAAGAAMDGWISKLFLEEGGGGTGEESYELTALYYARFCEFTNPDTRGVFFISGDESYYTTLKRADVTRFIGPGVIDADMPVAQVFHELQQKFDVYVLYPTKPIEERRKAIDAELAKRLEREGAKSGDVTISLMWNTEDDLDLAVYTPGGFKINYQAKKSPCGGELDVDMNASAPYNTKPVENVYWPANGGAPLGQYKVDVNLYGYHGPNAGSHPDVPFRLAVTINGETEMIDGQCTNANRTVTAKVFTYTGKTAADQAAEEVDRYGKYSDENVLQAWASVVPPHRVLQLKTPKAIVDVMLGVLAISRGGLTDSAYIKDLKVRGQDEARQEEVSGILKNWIAGEEAFSQEEGLPPAGAELCRQASSGSSQPASPTPQHREVDEMAMLKAQLAAMQAENERLKAAAAANAATAAGEPEPEAEA